jgi:hypothetical protein
VPVDHPDLEPIWKAAQDYDLPVVHHSLTWNAPYFPGYRDLWDNIFLGRLASQAAREVTKRPRSCAPPAATGSSVPRGVRDRPALVVFFFSF